MNLEMFLEIWHFQILNQCFDFPINFLNHKFIYKIDTLLLIGFKPLIRHTQHAEKSICCGSNLQPCKSFRPHKLLQRMLPPLSSGSAKTTTLSICYSIRYYCISQIVLFHSLLFLPVKLCMEIQELPSKQLESLEDIFVYSLKQYWLLLSSSFFA